jgi:hypothetical protein
LEKKYKKLKEMIRNIISEVAATPINSGTWEGSTSEVDDGPRYFWGNQNSYRSYNDQMAAKLGFNVSDYISGDKELPIYDTNYPKGPTGAVTYFPAGIDDPTAVAGTNVMTDLRGTSAYKEWMKNLNRILKGSELKLVDLLGSEESIEDSKKK